MEVGIGLESSPFAVRFDSNYVATESERIEIQTLISGPEARLEDLSAQLKALDEQRIQIINEQVSLQLSISKHRALISLVRRLPIDILQEIFIACLPTTHNAVMSKREAPILLTQVCSSWRHVAHDTPQLWKSIHIAVPCNTPGIYAVEYQNFQSIAYEIACRRSEAVLEWIKRSAGCPLDISLNQSENAAQDGSYDKIIDYLILFCERWRNVSFSAPYDALVRMAALPTSKVPLLESLNLNCSRLYFSPPPISFNPDRNSVWTTSGVLKAPKLHELYLTQLNEDATRLPINWAQLTNLSLEGTAWGTSPYLSVSGAHRILSLCRNLVCCRLEIGIIMEYGEVPLPSFSENNNSIVSLPFLTQLSIREGASISKLFTLLHLPALKSLEFHSALWPTPDISAGLLSLLTSSYGVIQHLITDAQFFKRQDFIKCLRLCPHLKSLAIRQSYAMSSPPPPWPQEDLPTCRIDDEFLEMFTSKSCSSDDDDPNNYHNGDTDGGPDDPRGFLCPDLEDFECSTATEFSETSLLQFIKGKNGNKESGEPPIAGLAKLNALYVTFHRHPLNDIHAELEPYKQAGLEAKIVYPPLPFTGPFSAFDGIPNVNQRASWSFY